MYNRFSMATVECIQHKYIHEVRASSVIPMDEIKVQTHVYHTVPISSKFKIYTKGRLY